MNKNELERALVTKRNQAILDEIASFVVSEGLSWAGTASELTDWMGYDDIAPEVLGKVLYQGREALRAAGVQYSFSRTSSKRYIVLEPIKEEE